ncbi:hypothetical protein NB724_001907 [Pantoea ananatis]|nr:hypothetical protein [Pantoea ananatis]MCW0335043.1 hypothetical protein [Pantoea ananatis]MCW0383653.1 hypothetical protein [Pantoea ananatis]MCW0407985.1 hypothetical protein [Pantoea ananatis]MCW0428188.1 hypothetical protein [Pantoea ananatis]
MRLKASAPLMFKGATAPSGSSVNNCTAGRARGPLGDNGNNCTGMKRFQECQHDKIYVQ